MGLYTLKEGGKAVKKRKEDIARKRRGFYDGSRKPNPTP
jgi:hypothetical protein